MKITDKEFIIQEINKIEINEDIINDITKRKSINQMLTELNLMLTQEV